MKKLLLFATALMVSVCSFAQWVKPADPQLTQMVAGAELYLFNKEAGGFLLGANDWSTRASVSPTLGHKVYIEEGTEAGSYYITNYVLEGGMKDQIGYMFMDNLEAIYVDNTKDGKKNNQYTLEVQDDGTYKIGLSPANQDLKPSDYPGAYLGLIPSKQDTRIYVCDPENSIGYQMSDCQLTWYFVAPEAYAAYAAAMKQYLAGVALETAIAEAETLAGVDADVLSAAKTLVANMDATAEDLDAQRVDLERAMKYAKYNIATPENPVEVLSLLGIATDFNDSDFSGWTSTTGASNKQASNGNNAKDYSITGNHYENWHWEAFTTGKVSATATDLPQGVYRLNALAFANLTGGTYLYAGECQKQVTATNIDIEKPTEVYAIVTDGKLEIGLDVQVKGPNWIGLDNVNLYYLGNSSEAYAKLTEETLNAEPDYEAAFASGEAYCQKAVWEAYGAAKTAFENSGADAAQVKEALIAFNAASKAVADSKTAYDAYMKKVAEGEEFVGSTTSESDEVALLSDYLADDTAAEGLYNGNGGAQYVLAEGPLDNTQIAAEVAYLEKILKEAMANSMADGDDCTSLLVNPNFAENGGWKSAVGPTWPSGDTSVFPVMEASNMVCDVYQELTGLQNGLYEFNIQAAFRPGAAYSEEDEKVAQAYAYINSFEVKVSSGAADNLNESAAASSAFAEGKYPVTVYGLVTDGTMKLGVTNKVRTVENCCLWAGGASLIFRAKNEEALNVVIAQKVPEAQALLENYAGMPELNALTSAIDEVQSPEDAYEALISLKEAMEAVEEGTTIYANFAVALKSLATAIENNTTASAITIKNAQALLDEAQNAYDDKAYNNEEAQQAISDLNAAVVSIKMGGEVASEDNPVDYSSMIVNPNFDPAKGDKNSSYIEGWTTTAMNGYKEYTVSYNRAAFELNQKLSGLPKGKYKVTVHTYYRAGYWNEEEQYIANGTETHLTTFYATTSEDTFSKPCLNLTEGATTEQLSPSNKYYTLSNGLYAPDGTTGTAEYFAAGAYLNELVFTVPEDGEVVIGLSKKEIIANDYQVVGEWKLYYMGDPDASKVDTLDVTDLIVNPNFDPAKGDKNSSYIEGWTTTAMNGYKEYTTSYNRAAFELNQTLSGLPKGKYKVTVHTYYRAGYWNEEEQYIANGTETHLTTFYATTSEDTFSKPCLNLTEGATTEQLSPSNKYYTLSNGLYAPDGTTGTAEYFAAGAYLNELEFTVPADGSVTIGLSKKEVLPNDYQVVGAWKLYYMGDPDASKVDTLDVTDLIVNANFDPAKGDKNSSYIEGWTTSALNGYKEYTASYNRAAIDLYQDLSGLMAGKYIATVHTYYRAGYWNEEEQYIANGTETHLTTLYATTSEGDFTTPCLNLTEGATTEQLSPSNKYYTLSNGLYAPDGTTGTAEYFAAGAYLNKIEFIVGQDGKARIGLSKTEVLPNDYQVVGAWNLYYLGAVETPEITETDLTDLIVNPNFDPAKGDKNSSYIEGWTTSALNGYKEYTASYNRAAIDLYQDLSGLYEGTYKVTVHTYYRAGYWNEEEQYIANGTETHLTTFYATTTDKTYSKPCLNLTEGATTEQLSPSNKYYTLSNGLYAPDGTTGTAEYFAAGAYLNELVFYVGSDGKARIGLSKTEVLPNDYQVVGAWNLYYYGTGDIVEDLATDITATETVPVAVVPVAYYSLSGTPLAAPVQGINIVKMSDGSVVKILVK